MLLLIFFSTPSFSQLNPCVMDIVVKHDTVFKNGEHKPYTGEYREYYPGDLKVLGQYVNGFKHGEFKYFGFHNCDSVVQYSYGLKNGQKTTYEADGYLDSRINYSNDTLDGTAYYWTRGQLLSANTYKKGKVISSQYFPESDSIEYLIFYLPNEQHGQISREYIESKDSIPIRICGTMCGNPSEIYYKCDTIQLNSNYKIVSFDISGWGTDSRVHSNSCYIKGSAKRMMMYSSFDIDVLIEAYGVQYFIPGRIIKTIK